MSHSIDIVVPGLSLPGQLLHDLSFDLSLPGLSGLLGCGKLAAHTTNRGLSDHPVAALIGAAIAPETIAPAAAMRRLGLDSDSDTALPADDSAWMCLDPVHLGFRERSIVVQDPAHLHLDAAEAAALAASLAPIIREFGELDVAHPQHWHVRLHAGVQLNAGDFVPLARAISVQARADRLPNKAWQIALNEAQMCLHQHPVNLDRARRGLPVVNSLWPWGAGQLVTTPPTPKLISVRVQVHADDPCLRGLARHHGFVATPPPASYAALPTAGSHLLVLDHLRMAAGNGDAQVWRDALLALDTNWFAPMLATLASPGKPPTLLTLFFPGRNSSSRTWQLQCRASWLERLRRVIGRAKPASSLAILADTGEISA